MPSSAKPNRSKGRILNSRRLDWQDASSGCHTWKINGFSTLSPNYYYYSDAFIIAGCRWRILFYPKLNESDDFAIYLEVPEAAALPAGWSRNVKFTLIIVNLKDQSLSTARDFKHVFAAQQPDWGSTWQKPHSNHSFLVDDTIIVKAEVHVLLIVPPVVFPRIIVPDRKHPNADTDRPPNSAPTISDAGRVQELNAFDSFFTELDKFIASSSKNDGKGQENVGLISGSPSLEEAEEAKQSLKYCLSNPFKLDIIDCLAAALSTLTRSEFGLLSDQGRSVRAFWGSFEDFISGFLESEQANSEFELHKLGRDQAFSVVKKNHETHLMNKQMFEALSKEEEELKKRMEEVKSRKERLVSDWQSMVAESEELKFEYTAQEKKLAESGEKKRVAEERMSRSAAAWSSLKALIL